MSPRRFAHLQGFRMYPLPVPSALYHLIRSTRRVDSFAELWSCRISVMNTRGQDP